MKIAFGKTAMAGLVAAALALSALVARADVFQARWECINGFWWLVTYDLSTVPEKEISRQQALPPSACPVSVGKVPYRAPRIPSNLSGPLKKG
jgi:hypothetical protein